MRRHGSAHSRRQFCRSSLGLVGLSVLAGCGRAPGPARPAPRIPRIGVISPPGSPSDPPRTSIGGLDRGLRDLGYVEGENLTIERRFAEGQAERLPGLAAELAALPVDVLVAIGAAIVPARDATRTVPIVMVNAVNPVQQGLAA